jgi:hypothetical protein
MIAADAGEWVDIPPPSGTGDMLASVYDPGTVAADVYDRANHSGEQAISTVTGLQDALDDTATAAQGALADTAMQPGDDATALGSAAAADGYVLTADGAGNSAWEPPAEGGDGLETTDINTLAKLNAIVADATLVTASAFAAVATTGAYSDLTGTPTLGTAAAANTTDFEPSGAVSTHESTYSHARIPSADQKAALDGANAPDAGNVFATMADVGAGGGGTVTSVSISGSDGIEIDSGSPVTTSGTIALGINASALQTHLGLDSAAYTPSTDYATAAQGSLADTAVQPGDLPSVPTALTDLDTTTTGAELNADHAKLALIEEEATADQWAIDVPVAAMPVNYSVEAADVEAHLAGIDTALGSVGTGSGDLSASDIDTLAELNAILTDATLIDSAALAAVATTGAYSDLSGRPTFGTAAAADTGDFEPSGAISTHESTHDHATLPSADQKAALDGANAPATGNVFATMADVGAGGSPILAVLADGTETTLPGGSAQLDAKLDAAGGTLNGYLETGAVLSISAGEVTIPLDGRIYAVTLDQAVSLLTSDAPTAPICGSAMLYLQQADPAETVTLPAWYWPDGEAEAFDTAGALYRLTLYTDPLGNIHADATRQAVPA